MESTIQSLGFLLGFHEDVKIFIIIIIIIVVVILACPDARCESGQTSGFCSIIVVVVVVVFIPSLLLLLSFIIITIISVIVLILARSIGLGASNQPCYCDFFHG